MDFITNASPGRGLIYDGIHIVPFINQINKETKQYEAMTTNMAEIKAIENRAKAAETMSEDDSKGNPQA